MKIKLEDGRNFYYYSGKTMKDILEEKGLGDRWSYCSTDTNEITEAPDNDWLSSVLYELEFQEFSNEEIVSLLEEYFEERKKYIISEWKEKVERHLGEDYEDILKRTKEI